MANDIYISVTILDFGNGDYHATLNQAIGDNPVEVTKLDINHAKRLMWELVLAGGKREYKSNMYDHSLTNTHTYLFLPN